MKPVTLLVALVIGAVSTVCAPPAATASSVVLESALPSICSGELAAARRFGADVTRLAAGELGLDGRRITISDDTSAWAQFDPVDATFTTRFHSLVWLVPAQGAGVDAVDLLIKRDRLLPDPGAVVGSEAVRAVGWTEGAVRLRLEVTNCLFRATGDERLREVADRLAEASLDVARYRGQPLRRVHNHATLSNLALLEAARVFDRPEWRDAAISRLGVDAMSIFSTCGMSAEQSTDYQVLNNALWRRVLEKVAGETSASDRLVTTVRTARLATWRLTRPDGVLEGIGNGNARSITAERLGVDDTTATDPRLLCSGRGWAANRGSWDDTATHYTLRFGEPPTMHGHEDRGALTWFTQGVAVFSDRGLYDKASGPRRTWAGSAAAHSTFEPQALAWPGAVRARPVFTDDQDVDRFLVLARSDMASMQRTMTIPLVADDSGTSLLRVDDTGHSRFARQWYQRWQLAPGWTALARTNASQPAAIHTESGLLLYGSCFTGVYGRSVARQVEHYAAWRTVVPAVALECGSMGTRVSIDTVWAVSPVRGTFVWDRASGQVEIRPELGQRVKSAGPPGPAAGPPATMPGG